MRIQHNIPAMNAYRNYNTNTSALSKNLEKLSSGYKINRAGDDAAGLAISEKMRAQITGLNAAQKNVKDGISLVKTAEGAMQEIQDMLNRMDYLATQSANGTYQDEVDRENLNKEMEALKTEINRIADSANFNGIKLLDGSLDQASKDAATQAVEDAQAALTAAQNQRAQAVATPVDSKGLILQGEVSDPTKVGINTIIEVDGQASPDPGFKVSFDGVSYIHTGTSTKKLTLQVGSDASGKFDLQEGTELTGNKGDVFTGKDIAEAFKTKILNGSNTVTIDGNQYKVEVENDSLVFTAQDNLDTAPNRNMDIRLTTDAVSENVAATGGSWELGTYTAGADGTTDGTAADPNNAIGNTTVSITANVGGQTGVTFTSSTISGKATAAELATEIGKLTATIDGESKKLSDFFDVAADGSGKITITSKATGADATDKITAATFTAATAGTGATAPATNPTAATLTGAGTAWTAGEDAYRTGLDGYVNDGTEHVSVYVGTTSDLLASTTLNLAGKLKDGTTVTLGKDENGLKATKYVIAVGDDSAYANISEANTVVVKVREGADEAEIASALSVAAKDNQFFTVSHTSTTGEIGLKQLQAAKDKSDMTSRDKIASYIQVSEVSAAAAEAAKQQAIADAQAKLTAAQAAAAKQDGKALSLQIGDTSDKFNQMDVSIGDMHVSAMGTGKATVDGQEVEITKTIDDIDILSQDNAQEAVNVIKNAINYVSSIRGDLGAVQNRLEHTGNNLSVMAENIQDAESTIRDTDVAEEMMSYVKNNILVQSAQAMLAQANQLPQGVLQLLG